VKFTLCSRSKGHNDSICDGGSQANILFPEPHDHARTNGEVILDGGGVVGELGAEIAGAEGAEGEVMIDLHIEAASNVGRQSVGTRSCPRVH